MKKVFLTKGVHDCQIVMPNDPAIVEKTAAEELQSYLKKALGLKYQIVLESEAKGKCIYVGQTEFAKNANIYGTSMENWIVAMCDGNLILTGGKDPGERGIIYAAYHFLEDFVGVRWWNPYEEDILTLDTLSLDEKLYKEGTPCFDYRKSYMNYNAGPQNFPFLARTRTNAISPLDDDIPDAVYDETVRKFGGARMAGRPHHVHTMGKYFPADQYFDEHPEWWAWNRVQGKHLRTGSYCFSNKELFEALVEKLLAIIKEDVELAEKTGVELPCFYSLSIDDVNELYFCQCEECARTIEEAGYAGYAMKFVNKAAREVAKVYPFAKVEVLVYSSFKEPPKDGTLPEKNCVVQLANTSKDLMHDVYAPTNKDHLRLMKAWSEICKEAGCEFYIYDYLYNKRTNYPLPLFYSLKENVKTYVEYGAKGVFVEAQLGLADVSDLNKYVLTHLLEDPDLDAEALIKDFMERYYGKAAKYVGEYLELLRETSQKHRMPVFCVSEDSRFNYIDANAAIKGSRLLDQAGEAVAGKAPFESRVNWLRKPLDAVILLKYFELKKMAEAEGEKFDFDCKTLKVRVNLALEEYAESPSGKRMSGSIAAEAAYFSSLPEEEYIFDIPKELRDVDEKDIFQFSLLHMPKIEQQKVTLAATEEEDKDAAVSKVLKISYDKAKAKYFIYKLNPTSKDAQRRSSLDFGIEQEGKYVSVKKYYREDLIPGRYQLYHLGSISGIDQSYNTRVCLCGTDGGGLCYINISGLAVTFPMEACEVYLSMKFTGEIYGGNPEEENAIYFERMIVVRK